MECVYPADVPLLPTGDMGSLYTTTEIKMVVGVLTISYTTLFLLLCTYTFFSAAKHPPGRLTALSIGYQG